MCVCVCVCVSIIHAHTHNALLLFMCMCTFLHLCVCVCVCVACVCIYYFRSCTGIVREIVERSHREDLANPDGEQQDLKRMVEEAAQWNKLSTILLDQLNKEDKVCAYILAELHISMCCVC